MPEQLRDDGPFTRGTLGELFNLPFAEREEGGLREREKEARGGKPEHTQHDEPRRDIHARTLFARDAGTKAKIGSGGHSCFSPRPAWSYAPAMKDAALSALVKYSDRLLRTPEVTDYDGAVNGLQVENSGRVSRLAAAVDASLATIRKAIEERADVLLVHHGLFWSKRHPWTGKNFELMRLLLDHDLAIYSSHLPLDMHPTLGNNAQLCASIGLRNLKPFAAGPGLSMISAACPMTSGM